MGFASLTPSYNLSRYCLSFTASDRGQFLKRHKPGVQRSRLWVKIRALPGNERKRLLCFVVALVRWELVLDCGEGFPACDQLSKLQGCPCVRLDAADMYEDTSFMIRIMFE